MTTNLSRNVFISGPLQGASDLVSARRFYEYLADICASSGYSPYLPHTATDPEVHAGVSATSVFERDLAAMRSCDVIVAYIVVPSSGVGAELALAYVIAQPVVGIWAENDKPSRFVTGMLEAHAEATLLSYQAEADLEQLLPHALEKALKRVAAAVG